MKEEKKWEEKGLEVTCQDCKDRKKGFFLKKDHKFWLWFQSQGPGYPALDISLVISTPSKLFFTSRFVDLLQVLLIFGIKKVGFSLMDKSGKISSASSHCLFAFCLSSHQEWSVSWGKISGSNLSEWKFVLSEGSHINREVGVLFWIVIALAKLRRISTLIFLKILKVFILIPCWTSHIQIRY